MKHYRGPRTSSRRKPGRAWVVAGLAVAITVAAIVVRLTSAPVEVVPLAGPGGHGPTFTAPSQEPAAPPGRLQMGFYPGDGPGPVQVQELGSLEARLGGRVATVVLMTDSRSVSDFEGSVYGELQKPGAWESLGPQRPKLVLSVPLAFGPFGSGPQQVVAGLRATAAGANDAAYGYLASLLARAGYSGTTIRLGWEFDTWSMPWSSLADPSAFVQAYRHVHDLLRARAPGLRFDWCGTAGGEAAWSDAYPGSAYVDSVGVDLYDQGLHLSYDAGTGTWADPSAAWSSEQAALDRAESFAVSHGKPVAVPEWGLSGGGTEFPTDHGGDDVAFVQEMYDWFASLPATGPGSLAFQAYFNANPPQDGPHALAAFPRAEQLFQHLFPPTSASGGAAPAAPTSTSAAPAT